MMNENPSVAMVQLLERVRHRPLVYIGSCDATAVVHFLDGIDAVCDIFGIKVPRYPGTIYEQVVIERGWEFLAARPVQEMQARGFNDEAIIHELLTIEIEVWKRTYNIA